MRPIISLLILTLALPAGPLGAQEDPIRLAPLMTGPATVSPGTLARTITAAQSAQEMGYSAMAAALYRDAIAQAPTAREKRSLTIALATALLDNSEIAEAEKALLSLQPPYDSAWNLRAGLVQVQKHNLPAAGGHLRDTHSEELTREDRGWWYFLQGRLAEAAQDPLAQSYYDQAVAAAVSEVQRTRFLLSRQEVYLRTATVTEADVEQARQLAATQRGTQLGVTATIDYAAFLSAIGRRDQAINVLRDQLPALLPTQSEVRDKILLQIGLNAATKTEAGRTALLQLLEGGAAPQFQRMALLLLANEPQAADFRRRLDALIARPEPHPILEDLLLKSAQLAAAEKTVAGYARATDDAKRLLASFPGSALKAPALALQASMEWEQKRYLGAADYAAQARAAATDAPARARLALLEAEALFRAREYRRAAAAYDAVLRERPADMPADVPVGDLLFQRLQAEVEATDFSATGEATRAATDLLDKLAADPAFDAVNRWQAEWNLARKLRAADQSAMAYGRVNKLLAPQAAATVLPPELRSRMLWLQAQLSLEAGQPETTIRLATALGGALGNVAPALAAEIRSTTVLLQGQAELGLGREKDAIATFDRLRADFKTSEAAAKSVLIQADYYQSKDRLSEAQGLLRRMPDEFPDSQYVPQALFNAALLDKRKGDMKEAANRLDYLASKYPRSSLVFAARLEQANLYRELKDFGPAQQIYQRLTQDYPSDPRVYDAEMGLADSYHALATADASAAERAAERYERLLDLADVRLDLRVEAGYKLGLVRQKRLKPEEALKVWWLYVVHPFLMDENQARNLGSLGRYWMGRTLDDLASLFESQNRPDDARAARKLLVDHGLPGMEGAALKLAAPTAGGTGP